ncbi:MAG: ParA family protein [Cyanobacteria bacterium P01_H01_bin.15]
MAYVISTVNMKGGVGKTTLTVNVAACLAKYYGKRVLVLDLDSQISATLSLMAPHDFAKTRRRRRTISNLIDAIVNPHPNKRYDINDMVCHRICDIEGFELLPGDIELYDEYLVSEMLHKQSLEYPDADFSLVWNGLERILIDSILEPVKDNYDYILMDCAPGYNLLTRSGIAASDYYLLPARPEPLSIVGIQLLERRIAKLKETYAHCRPVNINLLGIVFIQSANGLMGRYFKQVMRRVERDFTLEQRFQNSIPMDINVAKAVDLFMPAALAAPNSAGSRAFIKLTEEIVHRLGSERMSA